MSLQFQFIRRLSEGKTFPNIKFMNDGYEQKSSFATMNHGCELKSSFATIIHYNSRSKRNISVASHVSRSQKTNMKNKLG